MKKLLVVCCALTVFGGEIFAAAPVVPEPTLANVAYGRHPKQVLNFWKAKSDQPTPLVFFIHGGGWRGGDLSRVGVLLPVSEVLAAGISVVSIEYRFIPEATADKEVPPVRGPLTDAARALQFVRSKATEWNIDKARIAASGGSAGACSSLWLAFHPDLADPKNSDPVARESTRLWCAAVIGAQTTLDPQQMKEWTPNSYYGGHAFGFAPDPKQQGEARRQSEFDRFLADREKILPWIAEYSPYALVTADDPPVYLFYSSPPALGQNQKDPTHTANFGVKLLEKCKSAGVECEFFYPGATNVQHVTVKDYLIERLKSPRALGHGEGANNYPASERKGNVLPPVAKPKPAAGVTTGVLSLAKAKGDLQLTGWVQRAVRFIAAPVFTLAAPKDAVRYQAQLTDATGKTLKINSANPELNLADIWAKIAPGSFSGNISAVDQDGRVIASMKGKWHKARPFDKTMSLPPLPRPWPEVIERAMDFLINYRHLKGHDPKHPAILWHANYNFDNGNISAKVYPA
ncbi:MAG: alpha/beta hydrolase, partial [Verrucomicrobia bacterium]|nr:alpha/beta hydrolase [Verrucomicrobiota bacterium]